MLIIIGLASCTLFCTSICCFFLSPVVLQWLCDRLISVLPPPIGSTTSIGNTQTVISVAIMLISKVIYAIDVKLFFWFSNFVIFLVQPL